MAKLQSIKSNKVDVTGNPKVCIRKRKVFIPINELRNRALERLKTERVKFTTQEMLKIITISQLNYSPTETWINVLNQIKRDIRAGYLKYDALAMWLNPDSELAKDEPDLIREIAIGCGL